MPEVNKTKKHRLSKVTKELNVASSTLVEFLQNKGFEIENNLNAKLEPEMYDAAVREYASEKQLKEKAAQKKDFHKDLKQTMLQPEGMPKPKENRGEATPSDQPNLTPEQLKTNLLEDTERAEESAKQEAGQEAEASKSAESTPEAETSAETSAEAPTEQSTASESSGEDASNEESPKTEEEAPAGDKSETGDKSEIGLKVVGKIDLDATKSKSKTSKTSNKKKSAGKKPEKSKEEEHAASEEPAEKAAKAKPAEESTEQEPEQEAPAAEAPQLDLFGGSSTDQPEQPPADQPADQPGQATGSSAAEEETPKPAEGSDAESESPSESSESTESTESVETDESGETIRASTTTPRLQGLKVQGKIDLGSVQRKEKERRGGGERSRAGSAGGAGGGGPKDEKATGDTDDRNKRKRKRKRKKTSTPVQSSAQGAGARSAQGDREDVSKKEVNQALRSTLAQMQRGPGRKRQRYRREKRDEKARRREEEMQQMEAAESVLEVTEFLTANELANLMNVHVNEVIAKSMELGHMVSINQRLDREVIELVAEEFGYEVSFQSIEEAFTETEEDLTEDADTTRHPIVTVMGHVDHGKTSLLDHIRKENVIAGEAGGITQHIGAYQVTLPDDRHITFLDTPGHEAFTAMRARGAQVTDVAIIVIASDDDVMPQTKEAINHAQAAGVPIVFALNKVDKPDANPDRIREQLANMGYLLEDWGGKYQTQEISAKTGLNSEELMEKVLLEAELLELKANPERDAVGTVIEAELDKGRGVVATVLVQTGNLHVGDVILANCYYGRVKAMLDERGQAVDEAGPSTPVQILGFNGVPTAGDRFKVMPSDKEARQIAQQREQLIREQRIRTTHKRISLEQLAARSKAGDLQELNIIVKGDVGGSAEALADSLIKLSTSEVQVNIIMKGVGQISESDVLLASASDAIIVGFQVRPSVNARRVVEEEEVDLRLHSVIYDAINEVRDAMEGLLKPSIEEQINGSAEVRDTFRITKVGTIAGCYVVDGSITRNNPVRLIRDGIVVYTGHLESLKRFKDDVREVSEGYECGMNIEGYNDIKVGDFIESFERIEVKRKLEA